MGLLPERSERPTPQYIVAAHIEKAWLDWSIRELRYDAKALRVVLHDPAGRRSPYHHKADTEQIS
jgi:hypothetical protein